MKKHSWFSRTSSDSSKLGFSLIDEGAASRRDSFRCGPRKSQRKPAPLFFGIALVIWALFSLFTVGLRAQQPVAISLASLLQEMPAPPRTAEEAWQLMDPADWTQRGPRMKAFEAKLQKTQMDMMSPPSPTDLQQKYSDPAFLKQMDAMSTEEKVAMAMKMQAEMQARNSASSRPRPPSPEMRTAMTSVRELGAADAQAGIAKMKSLAADNAKEAELRESEKAAHEKIDADAIAAFSKMNFRDGVESPAAIAAQRKLEVAAWEKHFPLINDRLAQHRKAWDQAKAEILPVLTKMDAELAAVHYAADESAGNRAMMTGYQTAGIKRLIDLLAQSQIDLTDAAGWYQRYLNWKKSTP